MGQREFERELEREQLRSRVSVAVRGTLVVAPFLLGIAYLVYTRDAAGPATGGELLTGTVEAVRNLETDTGTRRWLVVALPGGSKAEVRALPSVPTLSGQRVQVRELLGADGQVLGHRLEGLAEAAPNQ